MNRVSRSTVSLSTVSPSTAPSSRPHRAGRYAALAVLAASGLILAGCGAAKPDASQLNPQAVSGASSAGASSTPVTDLQISPAPGTAQAATAAGITVTATHGAKIAKVAVSTAGDPVSGSMSGSGSSWHSTWALDTDRSYTVTATGTDSGGHPITSTSSFHTMTPGQSFSTEVFEGSGATYGVGMPIMLNFTAPITNKAAVERSLQLTTSKPVVGAWYWDGSEAVDFRPQGYWPPNTSVTLTAHLNGVDGGNGRYGTHTLTQSFNIGQSVIAVASTTTHQTQVYVGGQLKYTWPISTGRANMPTPDGTYLTVQKGNPVRMIGGTKGKPGYYNELVNWAVRFTFSGDYYHSAPWSVVDQGTTNVSHGCVNLPPNDAETYYNLAIPGDPITITGSPKAGNWDDGWTEWFLSWSQYLKGSATGMAVEAGPQGSELVPPSSVAASTAGSPLGTSVAGNYMAS
ncbi:MAG TPA: Ig-like domain-containing protein [Trebonia sp.]|nr:Ig-like domain-containing protein [Trebonia sp.]